MDCFATNGRTRFVHVGLFLFVFLPSQHNVLKSGLILWWKSRNHSTPDVKFWPNFLFKVKFHHFKEIVNHCELQNLFVNNSENNFEIGKHFPFQNVIVKTITIFVDSFVVQQDVFDKHIDDVIFEVGLTESLTPENYSSSCENTCVIKHIFYSFYFKNNKHSVIILMAI